MDSAALHQTIRPSVDRLLDHAARAGVSAEVPGCPGWDVGRLVGHVGRVQQSVVFVLENGEAADPKALERPPAGDEVLAWTRGWSERLLERLAPLDPDAEIWNWSKAPNTGAFWHRRMAHEAAMHAADAAMAAGADPEECFTPELAADGIDELLLVMLPAREVGGDLPGSLHVHCTDTAGEWLLEPVAGGLSVRREHAKGDAALRGAGAALLLRLANRGTGGEVVGDAAVLEAWRSSVRF